MGLSDSLGLGLTPDMLLGKPTLHVGVNLIVQRADDKGTHVTGVWQASDGLALLMGSTATHQLIMGDMFVRPQVVLESNEFRGHGLAGLARDGFIDAHKWSLFFDRDGSFAKAVAARAVRQQG